MTSATSHFTLIGTCQGMPKSVLKTIEGKETQITGFFLRNKNGIYQCFCQGFNAQRALAICIHGNIVACEGIIKTSPPKPNEPYRTYFSVIDLAQLYRGQPMTINPNEVKELKRTYSPDQVIKRANENYKEE